MLLRVALSDGTLNGREREALIEAAAELGVNASKFPGLGGDEYGRRQEVPQRRTHGGVCDSRTAIRHAD